MMSLYLKSIYNKNHGIQVYNDFLKQYKERGYKETWQFLTKAIQNLCYFLPRAIDLPFRGWREGSRHGIRTRKKFKLYNDASQIYISAIIITSLQ